MQFNFSSCLFFLIYFPLLCLAVLPQVLYLYNPRACISLPSFEVKTEASAIDFCAISFSALIDCFASG